MQAPTWRARLLTLIVLRACLIRSRFLNLSKKANSHIFSPFLCLVGLFEFLGSLQSINRYESLLANDWMDAGGGGKGHTLLFSFPYQNVMGGNRYW